MLYGTWISLICLLSAAESSVVREESYIIWEPGNYAVYLL